jgi:hypothetical protein
VDNPVQQAQAVLSITPARWLSLTEALPFELLARLPAPNEWSALDCLRHLLDTERYVFPVRVEAFLAGRDFEAFNPDTQGTKPSANQEPADLAAKFARHRTASLTALSRVTPADLSHTARHSELGIVSLSEMLHEWAAHDLMHTVQAERAMMQPFIGGCGPWRPYFSDHDIDTIKRE